MYGALYCVLILLTEANLQFEILTMTTHPISHSTALTQTTNPWNLWRDHFSCLNFHDIVGIWKSIKFLLRTVACLLQCPLVINSLIRTILWCLIDVVLSSRISFSGWLVYEQSDCEYNCTSSVVALISPAWRARGQHREKYPVVKALWRKCSPLNWSNQLRTNLWVTDMEFLA